jgi:ribosomal 50S subunit-associated protein YjgA (DUF615 family)
MTSPVSVVLLLLMMILLANQSRIERQIQIAVRLMRARDSAPILDAMTVLQETPDFETRHGLIYLYLPKNLV